MKTKTKVGKQLERKSNKELVETTEDFREKTDEREGRSNRHATKIIQASNEL